MGVTKELDTTEQLDNNLGLRAVPIAWSWCDLGRWRASQSVRARWRCLGGVSTAWVGLRLKSTQSELFKVSGLLSLVV